MAVQIHLVPVLVVSGVMLFGLSIHLPYADFVKTLQGLKRLDMSRVAVDARVQWFNGSVVQRGCSSPRETEVERETVNCKIRAKTRLGSNYSYYAILIVEESQPIVYGHKQR